MRIPVLFSFWLKFLNLDGIFVICFWTSFLNKLYSHQKRLTLSRSIVFIKKETKNRNYVCRRATPSLLFSFFSFFLPFLVIFYFPLHLSFISNKKSYLDILTFFVEKKKGNNVKENGNASYSLIFAEKMYFQAHDLHF